MKTKTLQTHLVTAMMLLGFLFISNVMIAQENEFNCLSRGDQQLTGFLVMKDFQQITNYTPYTVKFTASQRKITLKPNESITGYWITENTVMEDCANVTADGHPLSNLKSAVEFRTDFEKFYKSIPSAINLKTKAECDHQINLLKTKLNEIENWKAKIPGALWNGFFSGDQLIKSCSGLIKNFEDEKRYKK